MKTKTLRAGVAIGMLIVATLACVPHPPEASDIVGVWVAEQYDEDANPTSRTCFEFFADGTFEAYNVPREHFEFSFPNVVIGYVTGTWYLSPPPKDPFVFDEVDVSFAKSKDSFAFWGYFLIPFDWGKQYMFAGDWDDEGLDMNKQDASGCDVFIESKQD